MARQSIPVLPMASSRPEDVGRKADDVLRYIPKNCPSILQPDLALLQTSFSQTLSPASVDVIIRCLTQASGGHESQVRQSPSSDWFTGLHRKNVLYQPLHMCKGIHAGRAKYATRLLERLHEEAAGRVIVTVRVTVIERGVCPVLRTHHLH